MLVLFHRENVSLLHAHAIRHHWLCCCCSYSGSDLHELCRAAAFGPVRAAVDEMVAEQQQGKGEAQGGLARSGEATVESNPSGRTSRCLRKLVLDDFLEVIGGGDALTKESAKEYQEALASKRRKAAGSRSNTYRPGANMPDVAWKPPSQGGMGGGEAGAAAEKEADDRGVSDAAEDALRAVLSGSGGGGGEGILAGAFQILPFACCISSGSLRLCCRRHRHRHHYGHCQHVECPSSSRCYRRAAAATR